MKRLTPSRLRRKIRQQGKRLIGSGLIVALLATSGWASAADAAGNTDYSLESLLNLPAGQEDLLVDKGPAGRDQPDTEKEPPPSGKETKQDPATNQEGLRLLIGGGQEATTPLPVKKASPDQLEDIVQKVLEKESDLSPSPEKFAYLVERAEEPPSKTAPTEDCPYRAELILADLPFPVTNTGAWHCYLVDHDGRIQDLTASLSEAFQEAVTADTVTMAFTAPILSTLLFVKETEKAKETENSQESDLSKGDKKGEKNKPDDKKPDPSLESDAEKGSNLKEKAASEESEETEARSLKTKSLTPFITGITASRLTEEGWVPSQIFDAGEKIQLEIRYRLPDDEKGKGFSFTYRLPEGLKALAPPEASEEAPQGKAPPQPAYQVKDDNTIALIPTDSLLQEGEGTLTLWAEIATDLSPEGSALVFPGSDFSIQVMPPLALIQFLRIGSNDQVPTPETISEEDIAPDNYLQIIDHMPGATATISDQGSSVKETRILPADAPADDGALWNGNWSTASTTMFEKLHGGGRATAVRFSASNGHARNHHIDMDAGWDKRDLSLDSTEMKVTVWYHNAAYYQGDPVDAKAVIKVTPMKNRTDGANWDNEDYTNNPYSPMIQFSDTLYRGWCWQNVREINVHLTFYDKNKQPIHFQAGKFGDEKAAYYTINSLNEAAIQNKDNSDAKHKTSVGPEYVLPEAGTYTGAYIIPGSNIKTSYDGGKKSGLQHAYNGGENPWTDDDPSKPGWSKNSVLFTTGNTDHLSFTMGNLFRDPAMYFVPRDPWKPWSKDQWVPYQKVRRTNFVWTSMSTQSFTNHYVQYKDIPVKKTWSHPEDKAHAPIKVDLYLKYHKWDQEIIERVRTIELSQENDWQGYFMRLPDEDSMRRLLAKRYEGQRIRLRDITNVHYSVQEQPVEGYKSTVTKDPNTQGWLIHNSRNVSGPQLPQTGGPGRALFYLIGLAILMIALAYRRRKPRKGGQPENK